MKNWRKLWIARIGLRAGGGALIGVGWSLAVRLHHMAQAGFPRDAMTGPMLLAAILFLCASAGSALLFVGPGLWDSVDVSERWRRLPKHGSGDW